MAPPDEHLGQLGLPPPDWHLGPFGPPPPNEHLGPLGPPLPPPRTYRAHHVRAFLIRQARQARARDQARTECRDLVSDVTRECEEVEAWTPPAIYGVSTPMSFDPVSPKCGGCSICAEYRTTHASSFRKSKRYGAG
jgi:hypothetical protein